MFGFFKKKLSRKLIGMCCLLAAVICVATCVSGYYLTRESIYKSYNDFAYQIGEVARSYVDGDHILSYLETGETDAAYDEMAENIYRFYKSTSLYEYNSGIYICVPDPEKLTITNIYDVRVHEAPEEYKAAFAIGVEDPMGIDNPENAINVYLTGERSEDYFVHKTKFGYNSSAIMPVFNSNEEVVALLTADMPMPYITTTLTTYLIYTIVITLIVVGFFILLFWLIIRRTMIAPLSVIASEADAFTNEDIKVSDKLALIRQEDEIGHLAGSVLRMENDINTYVDNLTSVTAERERIGAELDIATNIQSSMLPCVFPAFPEREEFDIYASMTPAKEVGGDFYDFFMVDEDNLAVVMADVSGKGVPAALFMVIGKTLIKDHTTSGKDLGEVFTEVNELLCESNSEGLFITAFVGVLNLKSGELRYVNAGHEIPFICKKEDVFKPHKIRAGFVLAGMEGMRYKAGVLQMEAGDKLFQYTDGVTEATDKDNNLYGMDRLEKTLSDISEKTPKEILTGVKEDIDLFVGEAPQFDDITMLCVEYFGCKERDKGMRAEVSLDEAARLTEYIESTLEEAEASPATVIKMNIAFDEIFSNIVKFSSATYARIECGVEGEQAYLIFEDDGTPYNPLETADPDITLDAEERDIGGLGIFMVKKSMDSMDYKYEEGKNVLSLRKKK